MAKIAYKVCMLNSLPKSYKKRLEMAFSVKKDDFPLIVKYGAYAFIIWQKDLPIEYTLSKNL